jgi:hypothetical protein
LLRDIFKLYQQQQPQQTGNHRGEPVFNVSNAEMLLCGDVADGKHFIKCSLLYFNNRAVNAILASQESSRSGSIKKFAVSSSSTT